ncbi:hypothetical protein PHLH5_32770 [Pseudomonas sp. Cab53]|uniref:SMP-30/gluconolactonase/LRE family protein n=1 Tax=Pseudomonas sp. Cab53 TaxID=2678258 RepID=UPI001BB3514D|nr:SMP-30/gluconolactonase/LRE family protein [Pseudomonas sp. Cab53]BBP65736.1 hypothetical protein PHLH5_32770 [Pseudomonas sp. Cab53]
MSIGVTFNFKGLVAPISGAPPSRLFATTALPTLTQLDMPAPHTVINATSIHACRKRSDRRNSTSVHGALKKLQLRSLLACLAIGAASVATGAYAGQLPSSSSLAYDKQTQGPVPIPVSERSLPTVTAQTWFKASNEGRILEGAIFDREGNLLFCDVSGKRVLRLSPTKQLSIVATIENLSPGGLAFHPDGRLFIAALDLNRNLGAIFAVKPDGTGMQTIIAQDAGFMPNDLVFNKEGGFYFSDFKGISTEPKGGIYYVSPDLSTPVVVLPHLSMANGVTLSPDGKTLWATEFGRNLLHRIDLANATTIATISSSIPYRFTGPSPDSMRVDADGNVYVAIYGQGRVMVFNQIGIPIGQVLLPGREQGHNLLSTSLAIDPNTNTLYSVTSDGDKGQGATIFSAKVFTHGLPPASFK